MAKTSKRKRWRVVPQGAGAKHTFQSQRKAYEYVATVREWMHADAEAPDGSVLTTGVTVYLDDGSGWQLYETFKVGDA